MDFISCDWGTTHFRLRWSDNSGNREIQTDEGAARLAARGGDRAAVYRETLERGLEALGAPRDLPVVLSGMASSTLGWKELPYARLPFALDGSTAVWERLDARTILVSGFCSESDMVRGEETQALGIAATLGTASADPACWILPGTHSKHLEVRSGFIVEVRTFMTGELFDLLTHHSVLRHTTDGQAPFDADAFAEGVEAARQGPVTGALFQARTRQVLGHKPAAANASFLSGLLVGAELEPLIRRECPLLIAASGSLRTAYSTAARRLGLEPRLTLLESTSLTARGQEVLLRRLPVVP